MNASVFADSSDKSKLLGAGDDATSKKDERKKKAAGNHEINYYNTSNIENIHPQNQIEPKRLKSHIEQALATMEFVKFLFHCANQSYMLN